MVRTVITQTITSSNSQIVACTNLPVALTSFVGRREEIAQIKQMLATARLVTLTGIGGSGKTRLALEVATELAINDTPTDGVWWVELASLLNPDLVSQTVSGVLGLREVRNESFSETLVRFLRSRQLLLVLDNCEHLVAECAELSERLLSSCPNVKILTTSREALAIGAERIRLVSPLALPQSQHPSSIQTLVECEASRLFLDRAQAVNPGFSLTEKNASAILRICQRLDGIPLAIELAAARIRVLTVEQIAARLEDRFDLLTTGSRTALPRHQTLRAAIDWSYELLSSEESCLFRRLSVFAGGWTLEAAEAVCSDGDIQARQVLDLLSRLVDKSLVIMQVQRDAARYYFLETIRVYAHDKLRQAGETRRFHTHHLDFFLKFAEETSGRHGSWFYQERFLKESYSIELDNFRFALTWSLGGEEIEKGVRFAAALLWFWNIANFTTEGNRWLGKALAVGSHASPSVRANALSAAIYTYQRRGNYPEAIAFGEESVRIYRELGDMPRLALALRALARALCDQGNQERAIVIAEESIRLCRQVSNDICLVEGLITLATARQLLGDYEGSMPLLEESLALAQALQYEDGMYNSLGVTARVYRARGDFAQATRVYNQAMAQNWKTGYTFRLAFGLEFYAVLATLQKQVERAARLWGAAHALRQVAGVPRPTSQQDYAEYERDTLSQLGQDRFARLYAEGAAMPLEQAVEYAMTAPMPDVAPTPDQSVMPDKVPKQEFGGLTSRECDIGMLIAQGKSNREIAEQLVLSERTVETHIGNILSKLHFRSRTQIAAWILKMS